ncbi:putative soluble calcium-activated nucleotidase [Blattamonas nauphoetae]|uniref:Soluble calcium-activated nucleotidase n=1 Tax=Blattamonas nauphoetae TaxID=2049346 RepID=A0ABQ9YLH8_9EUKA|nr:putative soluble calcium-activated nucleotidase [Blattamonas nauphoetae]
MCDNSGLLYKITKSLELQPIQFLFSGNGTRFENNTFPTVLQCEDTPRTGIPCSSRPLPDSAHINCVSFPPLTPPTTLPQPISMINPMDQSITSQVPNEEMLSPFHSPTSTRYDVLPEMQKTEWACVMNGQLFIGSTGREFINSKKELVHNDMHWVSVLSAEEDRPIDWKEPFSVVYQDWTELYRRMREATGTLLPGYLLHEAVDLHKPTDNLVFVPKHESHDTFYDADIDECLGSDKIIFVSNHSTNITTRRLGRKEPCWGTSTFRFLPDQSHDMPLVLLKTTELAQQRPSLATKLCVYDGLTGKSLLHRSSRDVEPPSTYCPDFGKEKYEETWTEDECIAITDGEKYEGLAFLEGTELESVTIWRGKIIDLKHIPTL